MNSSDEKILCENCSQYIESSKFFLHERMCSLNVKKCPKCNKPFNIDEMDEHIKLEHSYVICDLCGIKCSQGEFEKHKIDCSCRLVPCKYCELNVIYQELTEHENICGSTTQKCEKCGLFIEKKFFKNHICQKKESEYLSEHIKIDNNEDIKKEKKNIKNKKNKKKRQQKNIEENEIINKIENNGEDIDMNLMFSSHEILAQIKALNKYEKKKNTENNNKNEENKKEKKKNKKKKEKDKEKEDEKEEEIKINNKKKKGKKNKFGNNKKKHDEFSDDDEDYLPPKKKMNLHNIKFDIPPEEYQNYNKGKKNNDYGYNDFIEEENMILEAMKLSLIEK